jgi:hypothetical protein
LPWRSSSNPEVFCDYDQQIDDTDRIFDEHWAEYLG